MTALTPQEEDDFATYGCSSRCLIELARVHKKPITKEAFISRYRGFFKPGEFGALPDSALFAIGFLLGLCSHASTIRRKETVKQLFRERRTSGIFVLTDWSPEKRIEAFHTQLLTVAGFDATDQWILFHPEADGLDYEMLYSDDELESALAHFLVFYPQLHPEKKEPDQRSEPTAPSGRGPS